MLAGSRRCAVGMVVMLSFAALARAHATATFSDVPGSYWAFPYIESCTEGGLVQGYGDGTYHPSETVTRDQMAVYLARALAGGDAGVTSPASPSFPDVPADFWAYRYIEYAKDKRIAAGYPDGLYHPANPVDRAQMAVFIARAIVNPTGDGGLADYWAPAAPSFADVTPDGDVGWSYWYVEYAKQAGVVTGYPDGLYHPTEPVTRDQMAVYLERAFRLPRSRRVVGYLPDYRLGNVDQINFDLLTNIIFFGLRADSTGSLYVSQLDATGLPYVVSAAHRAGVQVSACVGGWESDSYFVPLARSSTARARFISQLVKLCVANNLDGVDLDWEPVAEADVPAYATLIQELRAALDSHRLLLSVAVSSGHHDIPASAADSLSWVSVMAYDMNWPHAEHSTCDDTVAAMQDWAGYGVAKRKLLLGVPFYGRNEGWTSTLTYDEIRDQYHPALDQNWAGGYYFNSQDLIQRKTAYALKNGFGGMMIWELGQDTFDDTSLLAALAAQAGQIAP